MLSNCKYWLEEFRFDGFRFDGVTSMLYLDHGLGRDFGDYGLYFGEGVDEDAVTYLTLANRLVHEVCEGAVTVAEDVSGMPGLAAPVEWGGMGFDFRLSMGVPAYWTKLLERERDEDWHVGDLFFELTRKRVEERTIGYAESHDQALVGDKTIFHRLVDREVYEGMAAGQGSMVVDRGMALHKMIRLATAGTAGDGYLCFMGNEWGHPEWIDFPREGNGWSYAYARRQWSLVDDEGLRFRFLNDFDGAMVRLAEESGWYGWRPEAVVQDVEGQVLAWRRGDWLFVFNFSPGVSREGYGFGVTAGKYVVALGTDEARFDGLGRTRRGEEHFTIPREGLPEGDGWLRLYLPARTGMVLHRE